MSSKYVIYKQVINPLIGALWNLLWGIKFFSEIRLHHLYYRANIRIDAENSVGSSGPVIYSSAIPGRVISPGLYRRVNASPRHLGRFLSLRGKCHLKSWLVLTRKREKGKRGRGRGAKFDDSTAAVKTLPHPSRRISCHRLHRSLSSPAMKQMIKASTRMLWMDRRIHPRISCPAAWPPDKAVRRVSQFPSDCELLDDTV